MKFCAIAFMFFILLTGLVSISQADSKITQQEQVTVFVEDVMYNVLGSKIFSYSATSPVGPTQPGPLSLTFTLGIDSQPGKTLFEDVPLVTNVGKCTWVNAACAHPSYSSFIIDLTDGRNDRLSGTFTLSSPLGVVSSTTTHVYESSFFPGNVNHDFKGSRIGRIGICVETATVTQTPVFVGGVPEPYAATVLVFGLASTAALWIRKRR